MKKYTWSFSYIAPNENNALECLRCDLNAILNNVYSEPIPTVEELTPEELKYENEDEDEPYTGN